MKIEKRVLLRAPLERVWRAISDAEEFGRWFAYRWHPFAVDPDPDYDQEPTTLVEFTLSETPDGVLLTITESGFEAIPEARRSSSFEANAEGWAIQAGLVRRYTEDARV